MRFHNLLRFGVIGFFEEPTSDASSSAATQNTDSSAGTQNTDSSAATKNTDSSVENKTDLFAAGINEGIRRFTKKLGLPSDLAEAAGLIDSLKTSAKEKAQTDSEQARVDAEARQKALQDEVALWKERASVAKAAKLQALALDVGVGKGSQLETFIKMFGDQFAFSDRDGRFDTLVTIGNSNGVVVELPNKPEDKIKEILEQHGYLKQAPADRGEGAAIGGLSGESSTFASDPFGASRFKKRE